MTKNTKAIELCARIKEVLERAGEVDYEDLGRRDKQEIYNLVVNTGFNFDYDGDSDGCYLIADLSGHIELVLGSHAEYTEDFEKCLSSVHFNGAESGDTTLEHIDSIIAILRDEADDRPPLALLNTSIITADGEFTLRTITLDDALELVESANGLDSAIGHDSTAQIMSELLRVDVPVNRQMFEQQPGQQALVFKLNGRPPEGAILSREDIEKIGYSFKLLSRND